MLYRFLVVPEATVKKTQVVSTKTVIKPKQIQIPERKQISLWQVSAGYEWETEYERVVNRLENTINDASLSEHIAWECYAHTDNPKLCVKNMVWVSNSEWTLFRNCSTGNNCFGVMQRQSDWSYKLRVYANKKESISAWIELYNKLGWYKRTTAQARLDGNYCTSSCSYWIGNYNKAVEQLGI